MAFLDPNESFEHFRERVVEGIQSHFPIQGKVQSVHLDKIEVDDKLSVDDIRSQHKAKLQGDTWAVPVYAQVTLKDNATGKVVDQRRVRVAEIPKMTKRYSYIMEGQEYQLDNQWQLRPGVYAQRRQNGELEARFNVVSKPAFDLLFDPESKQFSMEYNKSKIPLYPILKGMGVDDETLERNWGKEILHANRAGRNVQTALERFYKTSTRRVATSKEEAEKHLLDTMQSSKLKPDVTHITLGKPFEHVTGEALHLAASKLLKIQSGHPEDDRDSLVFKDLRTAGDYAYDKIRNAGRVIKQKVDRKINTTTDVRDVVKFDTFNQPIKEIFRESVGRVATQINPAEMVSSSMQTTVMGPGGIKSEQSITDVVKLINPSHFGFLDPILTPEGSKTGVTLRLPIGVKKIGNQPHVPLYNLSTKKTEPVSPGTFLGSKVVLPDQVQWVDGVPKPISDTVKMIGDNNEITHGKFSDAQFVMRSPSQFFNMTSNLIPFLGNTSGNRAGMAGRHMEQAISLLHRQAPLVQVATGSGKEGIDSFEKLIGQQASHQAPVSGHVEAIHPDAIHIKDESGKTHEVQIYNHYPLNDAKSVMHSTPVVKVGDKVKPGQVIADTNFSDKGALALGSTFRVAFVPYKGYNFEDGVVISESAAKKFSSVHLHKPEVANEDGMKFAKKDFLIHHPSAYTKDQLHHIDDSGLPKVGSKVRPGDPLVLAVKPYELKDRTGMAAIRKSLSGAHTDKSLRWDSDFEGEIVGVHKSGDRVTVHVRTVEPMQVGDKLSGRHGNKGVVGLIVPDHEMPKTSDGKPIEVALNPSGVPGRMNIGQVLEAAAGKIAQKTGKPYMVQNFQPNTDYLEKVKKELHQHGLSDTEELLDPSTGQPMGKALVGPMHLLKLVHQVDKKVSARAGMGLPGMPSQEHYDLNLQPAGGKGTGGQSIGALGTYALLAHGAKATIREMQTFKSEGPDPQTNDAKKWPSQHNDVWRAIQTGSPYPTPKPTFAFQKFTDMLRGAGINVDKKGHEFILSPMTDKHVLQMSNGELKTPGNVVRSKPDKNGQLQPIAGGLFDEKITGGHGGKGWSHISLAEPLPNPIFERPIMAITGLKQKEFESIIHGEKGVSAAGKVVEPEHGVTGGAGIKILLDRVDVQKELERTKKELAGAPASKVDPLFKKAKYLRALNEMGVKPSEAYVLHHLPVLPPVMRPLSTLSDGNVKFEDINGLYKEFGTINDKLKDPAILKNFPESKKKELRVDYYDGVRALMGVGLPYDARKEKGLLHTISGSSPKMGMFQNVLTNRRQDMTMRSTIVPEPALGLDEVALPKESALTLFRPFVVRQLTLMGGAGNPLDAQKLIADVHKGKNNPMVWKALEKVIEERPVLMKRDPALHKYSVQGFRPRLTDGTAIKIHPLVTGGFNADFDGDTVSIYVPITHEAVQEAHKMMPSNNLFNEATGKLMYQPTLESALGLYKLSRVGQETSHKFATPEKAVEALKAGKVHYTDQVQIGGQKTTPGRAILASVLPESMKPKVLTDMNFIVDKKGLPTLLTDLAKNHREQFGTVVNQLKDIGNYASFGVVKTHLHPEKWVPIGTHSLALKDFTPDTHSRDPIIHETSKKVDAIYRSTSIPKADKDRQAIDLWSAAEKQIQKAHEQRAEKDPSNLFLMYKAGVKPGWDQYKQMTLAPMLFQDSQNRTIPLPVTKSYAEGLDVAGYWTTMHGARRGAVMKVQEVQEPGYMSKLLMNTAMNVLIDKNDCGTTRGVHLPIEDRDVHDRHLAHEFKAGNVHIPAGTLLSPDVVGKIRAVDPHAHVVVRSPLKCDHDKGVCQKCAGLNADGQLHPLGTNLGVMAAHAVGERAVQLTLKSFHQGGVKESGGGSKALNSFAQFQNLTMLPKTIPDAASLAMVSGTVEKIEEDPTGAKIWINGKAHHVGKDSRGMSLHQALPHATADKGYTPWGSIQVGMKVEAGQHLSDPNRTTVNPHDLYSATKNIDKVQNHITSEIYKLYKDEGVKRRMIETVVRSMSNLTKVVDPGDHPHLLRGEFHPTSVVKKLNDTDLKGKNPIVHSPVLRGLDMLPLELHEDWMAKLQHTRLRGTIMDSAAVGSRSNIHGSHPIPGVAYGAEFGMTAAKAKQPGYGHLKDVPEHNY